MNDTATMVIRLSLNGAQEVARGVHGVIETFGSIPHVLGTVNEHAFFLIENLRNAIEIAHRFGEVLAESFIMPNAEKERYRAQFEFMLGTAEAAAKRLDELDAFKAKNPFDEKSIIEASLSAQRFGDGMLAQGKGFQMILDAAAFSGAAPQELAASFGRARDALMSGGDLGRVSMELQRLGILSKTDAERLDEMTGAAKNVQQLQEKVADLNKEIAKYDAEEPLKREAEQRRELQMIHDHHATAARIAASEASLANAFEIEQIQQKRNLVASYMAEIARLSPLIKTGEDAWLEFTTSVNRVDGAAAKMRGTFTGTMQALRNDWDEFKERIGTSTFGAVNDDVKALEENIHRLFETGTIDRWANRIGDELKKLYSELKGRAFLGLGFEDVEGGLNSGTILSVLGVALKDSFLNAFAELYNIAITKGPDIVSALTPGWMRHFVQQDTADEMRSLAQGNNPGALSWAAQSRLAQELMKQTGGRYEAALAQVSGMMDGNGSGLAGLQKLAASNIHFDLMPLIDIQADLQRRNIGRYALEADLSGSQAVAGEQVRLMRLMELSLGAANKEAAALAGNLRSANAQF